MIERLKASSAWRLCLNLPSRDREGEERFECPRVVVLRCNGNVRSDVTLTLVLENAVEGVTASDYSLTLTV